MIQPSDSEQFALAIENAHTIVLASHVNPDGDTLGSMLGLKFALAKHYPHIERIDGIVSGPIAPLYKFMPGVADVHNSATATDLLPQYDLAFSVDCGSADRLEASAPYFVNAKTSVNIDHHISNTRFGTINIIDAEAGASGEVVADLLEACGIAIPKESAIAIYTAILTDTGGFKYSSTSARIFDWAAKLTTAGADPEQIFRAMYDEIPKAQTLLQAAAIGQAQFNADNTLAWIAISQDFLRQYNATEAHIEGLVETLRRIDTIKVAAVLKEARDGNTKVSLRSDTQAINVADIVANWGGGGHKMASGCTILKPLQQAEAELLPYLHQALETCSIPA